MAQAARSLTAFGINSLKPPRDPPLQAGVGAVLEGDDVLDEGDVEGVVPHGVLGADAELVGAAAQFREVVLAERRLGNGELRDDGRAIRNAVRVTERVGDEGLRLEAERRVLAEVNDAEGGVEAAAAEV